MSVKKKTHLNQRMPIRHTILSDQGTVITEIPELIYSQNLAKKTKLRQQRRQNLIMASNGSESVLSVYLGVYRRLNSFFLVIIRSIALKKSQQP